jgi:N-acetylneuraminic acid mutarotase
VHQVFISYAEDDYDAASRVCEMLEADGKRCWLASRDAVASENRAAEILKAIRSSDLVLLVFSAPANASPTVLRDIERAVAYERPVLSIQLDDAVPSVSLQHYLNLARQPSAIVPSETAKEPELGPRAEAAGWRRLNRRTWGVAVGVTLLVLAIGLGLGLGLALGLNRHHSAWTELKPSGALPPARAVHAMAYDPSTHRLVVFGGGTDTGDPLDDTWAYDPTANTWTELKPSGTVPSPRLFASMAYDPTTRRLIMFGGLDETDAFLNDTWAYDSTANTWTNLDPAGALPPARAWNAMVCDSDTGKLIMFGGAVGALDSQSLVAEDRLNDTWAYDPAANIWTELKPAGAVPVARYSQVMAYDPYTHKVILHGGMTATARFNDTWAYDPAANIWTELKPAGTLPSPRGGHSMAYDPTSGRLIMFGGGVSRTTMINDTWAYDPAANMWTELKPAGTLPSPRGGHSMAYDPTSGRLIMFGGADDSGGFLDDTWALIP